MKKTAFSMMDLIIAMVVVCVIMAFSVPFMTQKTKRTTEDVYGEFICYAAKDSAGNWGLYHMERHNSDVLSAPKPGCNFIPPNDAKSFNITVIGGGGGGASSSEYFEIINNPEKTLPNNTGGVMGMVNLTSSNFKIENPFGNDIFSDADFGSSVLSKITLRVTGADPTVGATSSTSGHLPHYGGSSSYTEPTPTAPTNTICRTLGASDIGKTIERSNGSLPSMTVNGAPYSASSASDSCTYLPIQSNEISAIVLLNHPSTGGTTTEQKNEYYWQHTEEAIHAMSGQGGKAGDSITDTSQNLAKVSNIDIQLSSVDTTGACTCTGDYCVGVGGKGGEIPVTPAASSGFVGSSVEAPVAPPTDKATKVTAGKNGCPSKFALTDGVICGAVCHANGGNGGVAKEKYLGTCTGERSHNFIYYIAGTDGLVNTLISKSAAKTGVCTSNPKSISTSTFSDAACDGESPSAALENFGSGGAGGSLTVELSGELNKQNCVSFDGASGCSSPSSSSSSVAVSGIMVEYKITINSKGAYTLKNFYNGKGGDGAGGMIRITW